MADVVRNLVAETATCTGTGGTYNGSAALNGHLRWSAAPMAVNDRALFVAREVNSTTGAPVASGKWEVFLGTYSAANQLTRTTVIDSSSGSAINWAGTETIYVSMIGFDQATPAAGSRTLSPAQITANQNNYNPTGFGPLVNTLRLNVDALRIITGLAAGLDGQMVHVINVSTGADGDLILAAEDGASTAANRFAIDSDILLEPTCGAVLVYDGAAARWRAVAVRRKYTGSTFRLTPFYATDFLGGATADTGEASYAIWDYAVIATGTQSKVASEPTHPGILRTTSSTTTNSGGVCRTAADAIRLRGGEIAEFVFRCPDLTTLTARLGFIDTATSTDCVDGAYLEVLSTGAVTGKTSNNSTRTTSATIATLTGNVWYRGRIVVNRDATAVDFYIFDDAGNLLGSQQNTANIPTAAGRQTGHGYIATKSGTVAQNCIDVDFMSLEFTRALA